MAVLGQFEDLLTIVQRVSSDIAPLDHCHAPNLNEGPVSGFRDDSFTLSVASVVGIHGEDMADQNVVGA
jgi:hypothetical protein